MCIFHVFGEGGGWGAASLGTRLLTPFWLLQDVWLPPQLRTSGGGILAPAAFWLSYIHIHIATWSRYSVTISKHVHFETNVTKVEFNTDGEGETCTSQT